MPSSYLLGFLVLFWLAKGHYILGCVLSSQTQGYVLVGNVDRKTIVHT